MNFSIRIDEFLQKAFSMPVIDVRSPSEFAKGHIPGALNICLFNDEERAEIGTLYHKVSSKEALDKGYQLVSPKLDHFVKTATAIAPEKKVLVHCWRGGVRSESFALLLHASGFEVFTLQGGYQAYRRRSIEIYNEPFPLIVLGGMTGSGKTNLLQKLAGKGIQVVDLERIAHHKGSVFGAIGQAEQPLTEQFQNDLFAEFSSLDRSRIILMEDENMDIGNIKLPEALYKKIRNAPLIDLQVARAERAGNLVKEYSGNDDELVAAIRRIERRLGNEHMKRALDAVSAQDYLCCAEILLVYYDKSYRASIAKRLSSLVFTLEAADSTPEELVRNIQQLISEIARKLFMDLADAL